MSQTKITLPTKPQWAWALSDWANSAYTTTVITVFFPIFFKQYWASSLTASESTFYLGFSNSLNSIILFVIAPFLGAIADISGRKKSFLLLFTLIGSLTLIPFYFIQQGDWLTALIFFTLSNIGYWASLIFYDALIMNVANAQNLSFVSSLGFSLGYLGGGLLIVLNAWAVTSPHTFGLASAADAVKWSFLSVAVWWILFSLPLYFWVPEIKTRQERPTFAKVLKDVLGTFKKLSQQRALFYFLLGYIFYIDGVNTVIKMAVDFALSIGLESSDLIKAIILVQFVGFPATLAYAWIAHRIGDRRSIYLGLSIYSGVTIYCFFVSTSTEFYTLALVIALAQGGIQAMSRSYFGKMTPPENAGEFFGIYNMVGKFSAILGPLCIGVLNLATNNPRLSLSVVLLFFVAGAVLLSMSSRAARNEPT